MTYDRKKDMYRIFANVYVERDSQKGIIIGKGGEAIKKVGMKPVATLSKCSAARYSSTCR